MENSPSTVLGEISNLSLDNFLGGGGGYKEFDGFGIIENIEVYVAQALMVRTALLSAYLKFSRSLGGNVPYAYVVFLQALMPQDNLISRPV